MTISSGDKIPSATLTRLGKDGPEQVALDDLTKGRKVVIFAVPGAYTGVCQNAHIPSFIRSMDALRAKGVDEVICISVNDPFVMAAWGEATGATSAGIILLGDAEETFTKAMGRDFTAPPAGLINRSRRYAMVVEDSTGTRRQEEDNPGQCNVSAGEAIVAAL